MPAGAGGLWSIDFGTKKRGGGALDRQSRKFEAEKGVFAKRLALLKSPTVISAVRRPQAETEASLRDAKWRNLFRNRFLDSPAARSK